MPVAIWTSGTVLLHGQVGTFEPRNFFSLGLRALWTVQAVASGFMGPWLLLRFGFHAALMGQLLFAVVPLPLLVLCWLAGAASLTGLAYGLTGLIIGAVVIIAATGSLRRLLSRLLPAAIGTAALQVSAATLALLLVGRWLRWIGL